MKNGKSSTGALDRVPAGMKVGYGAGDFAANLVFQSATLFLLFFYTDVFLVGASTAGLIFLVAKLWDAFIDPVIGHMSDRTESRWGKKRPYLLFGAVPLGISFFLLFAGPALSDQGRIVYAFLTFLLFCTAYPVVNIPYGALTANMTTDSNERSSITGYRMMFAILGTLLAAGATRPVAGLFATPQAGFRVVGAIFGVIVIVVTLVTFMTVRERVSAPVEESRSLREDLKLVLLNKPFILLVTSSILQLVAINTLAAMINYYFKYNLNAEAYIPLAFLGLFVVAMITMPFWIFFSNRFGKKHAYNIGMALMSVVLVLLYFMERHGVTAIIALIAAGGIGMSTFYLCPWAMLPDTVEYAEWKTGLRREGILYGFYCFATKLSGALAGFLCGLGLGIIGYVPNVTQCETALTGIRTMMTFIPTALIAAGIILVAFYPINAEVHRKMVLDIEARSAKN